MTFIGAEDASNAAVASVICTAVEVGEDAAARLRIDIAIGGIFALAVAVCENERTWSALPVTDRASGVRTVDIFIDGLVPNPKIDAQCFRAKFVCGAYIGRASER